MSTYKAAVRSRNSDGTMGRTNLKKALRYVKRGLAHWEGEILVFARPDNDYRAASVVSASSRYTSGVGFASLSAVENLPVAGPAIRLFTGHRPAEPPREIVCIEVERRYMTLAECLR